MPVKGRKSKRVETASLINLPASRDLKEVTLCWKHPQHD